MDVGINAGSANARLQASIALKDPGIRSTDGKIYLSELSQALKGGDAGPSWSQVFTPVVTGTFSATFPVTLQTTIDGLALGTSPRLLISWPEIQNPQTLRVTTQGLDSLLSLEKLTTGGLTESIPLSRLNDGAGMGIVFGQPDFQLRLRDGRNINVSLSNAVNIGEVFAAIRTATDGDIRVEIGETGDLLRLIDTTTGSRTFSVASLNGSTALSDLGLLRTDSDNDGIIEGSVVYTRGILGALEQLAGALGQIEAGQALMNASLPLINVSLNDALAAARQFDTTLKSLRRDPASSIQRLETFLESSLGLPADAVQLRLVGKVLRIDMRQRHALAAEKRNQTLQVDLGSAIRGTWSI